MKTEKTFPVRIGHQVASYRALRQGATDEEAEMLLNCKRPVLPKRNTGSA